MFGCLRRSGLQEVVACCCALHLAGRLGQVSLSPGQLGPLAVVLALNRTDLHLSCIDVDRDVYLKSPLVFLEVAQLFLVCAILHKIVDSC